ncbi:MAG: hypothetical protein ACE5E3_05745 [Mariprofundus sp.]
MQARTNRSTTVIRVLFLTTVLLLAMPAFADSDLSVDARFDKTGDGLVDVSDWQQMSDEERQGYARASVEALGEDPDVQLEQGRTRAQRYLEGLRSVYE